MTKTSTGLNLSWIMSQGGSNKNSQAGNIEKLLLSRPLKRSECREASRPCPWVSCKYHLYLDVNRSRKSLNVAFPKKDVVQLEETCALDVADEGPHTLEEIGDLLNISRERVRQIVELGLSRIPKEFLPLLREYLEK